MGCSFTHVVWPTNVGDVFLMAEHLVAQNGIKFHPKEFAYLSESVCKAGQGRDPKTKQYPSMTGPSLQSHFTLIGDSKESIHGDRSERLRKMAEQASPVVSLTGGTLSGSSASLGSIFNTSSVGDNNGASGAVVGNNSSVGSSVNQAGAGLAQDVGGSSGSSLVSGASAMAGPGAATTGGLNALSTVGSGGNVPSGPGGGSVRPVKSSGLFVKSKPSGSSFLRNNASRPGPLPRSKQRA